MKSLKERNNEISNRIRCKGNLRPEDEMINKVDLIILGPKERTL